MMNARLQSSGNLPRLASAAHLPGSGQGVSDSVNPLPLLEDLGVETPALSLLLSAVHTFSPDLTQAQIEETLVGLSMSAQQAIKADGFGVLCRALPTADGSPSPFASLADGQSGAEPTLSAERLLEMFQTFELFDSDRSGSIDERELRDALGAMGLIMAPKLVKEMFAEIDSDHSGTIDFLEFVSMISHLESSGSGHGHAGHTHSPLMTTMYKDLGLLRRAQSKKVQQEHRIKEAAAARKRLAAAQTRLEAAVAEAKVELMDEADAAAHCEDAVSAVDTANLELASLSMRRPSLELNPEEKRVLRGFEAMSDQRAKRRMEHDEIKRREREQRARAAVTSGRQDDEVALREARERERQEKSLHSEREGLRIAKEQVQQRKADLTAQLRQTDLPTDERFALLQELIDLESQDEELLEREKALSATNTGFTEEDKRILRGMDALRLYKRKEDEDAARNKAALLRLQAAKAAVVFSAPGSQDVKSALARAREVEAHNEQVVTKTKELKAALRKVNDDIDELSSVIEQLKNGLEVDAADRLKLKEGEGALDVLELMQRKMEALAKQTILQSQIQEIPKPLELSREQKQLLREHEAARRQREDRKQLLAAERAKADAATGIDERIKTARSLWKAQMRNREQLEIKKSQDEQVEAREAYARMKLEATAILPDCHDLRKILQRLAREGTSSASHIQNLVDKLYIQALENRKALGILISLRAQLRKALSQATLETHEPSALHAALVELDAAQTPLNSFATKATGVKAGRSRKPATSFNLSGLNTGVSNLTEGQASLLPQDGSLHGLNCPVSVTAATAFAEAVDACVRRSLLLLQAGDNSELYSAAINPPKVTSRRKLGRSGRRHRGKVEPRSAAVPSSESGIIIVDEHRPVINSRLWRSASCSSHLGVLRVLRGKIGIANRFSGTAEYAAEVQALESAIIAAKRSITSTISVLQGDRDLLQRILSRQADVMKQLIVATLKDSAALQDIKLDPNAKVPSTSGGASCSRSIPKYFNRPVSAASAVVAGLPARALLRGEPLASARTPEVTRSVSNSDLKKLEKTGEDAPEVRVVDSDSVDQDDLHFQLSSFRITVGSDQDDTEEEEEEEGADLEGPVAERLVEEPDDDEGIIFEELSEEEDIESRGEVPPHPPISVLHCQENATEAWLASSRAITESASRSEAFEQQNLHETNEFDPLPMPSWASLDETPHFSDSEPSSLVVPSRSIADENVNNVGVSVQWFANALDNLSSTTRSGSEGDFLA